MKISRRAIIGVILPLCFLLLHALPVSAINGSPISDIMTVYKPDGSIFYQISVTEAEEIANGPGKFYFLGYPDVAVDTNQIATVFYEKGGDTTVGPWSDIVGWANRAPDGTGPFDAYGLAFRSDVDGAPNLSLPAFYTFVEETPGVPYNITKYLGSDLKTAGYTATFVSDADVSVPEPSTMLLLGAGLAGVGLFKRKLRT